jgi:tetratricopeptide (TPR) repeat protein
MFTALVRFLERVRGDAPVVVTIDDVHFADDALIDWLHFVARRATTMSAVIVLCRRPLLGRPLPEGVMIQLAPLDLPAVAAIAGDDRAGELLARSGGSPLLIIELAATAPAEPLPDSLLEAVARRVGVTGAAAMTLRAAAVLGPDIDLDLLSSVLGEPALAVLGYLEIGVTHGFLVERTASFAFAHALVREATAERVPPARRALLHREAARILAGRAGSDPVIVAHHARLAGDTALAAAAFGRAASVAALRLDLTDAERFADMAVRLDDTASSRLVRGRIRLARGQLDDARHDAMSALIGGGGTAALELAGWAAYYRRDFGTAREAADDGLRLAPDPEVAVGCLMLGGRVRHAAGDLVGSEPLLVAAAESAVGSNRAVAAVWLGSLRLHQGDAEATLGLVRPATLPGAASSHHAAVPHAWMHSAHALAMLGRPAAALAALDELDGEVSRRGLESFHGRSDNFRAWILRNLGLASEAAEANERGVAAGRSIGMAEPQAQGLVDLADARLRGGDPDGCLSVLSDVKPFQSVDHAFRWRHVLRSRLLTARANYALGDFEGALADAESVATDGKRLGVERYSVAAQLEMARSRLALGEPVDRECVDGLLAGLERVAAPEAWWMTAEMAAAFSEDRWWEWAGERLDAWTARAGDRRDEARTAASAFLARQRRAPRSWA